MKQIIIYLIIAVFFYLLGIITEDRLSPSKDLRILTTLAKLSASVLVLKRVAEKGELINTSAGDLIVEMVNELNEVSSIVLCKKVSIEEAVKDD